jgi:hypothetical protein
MRYLIGTSFFLNTDFKLKVHDFWYKNIRPKVKKREEILAIYEGGFFPDRYVNPDGEVLLNGDLGHIGAHLNGSKPFHLTGWSASVCALAMLAYIDESDFIYVESDCFPFGPWIDRLYKDAEGAEFVFGPKMTSAPWMSCAQSLFLVKHSFIPAFVSVYLSLPADRDMLGEDKFVHIEARYPQLTKRLSFGVDRMRPIPWNDEVFYFQQPTQQELDEAIRRGLL